MVTPSPAAGAPPSPADCLIETEVSMPSVIKPPVTKPAASKSPGMASKDLASYEQIAFVASPIAEAQQAMERLTNRYGQASPDDADVIVALGGDGLMLQTLHKFMHAGKPIYGMHRGTVGFLMNEYREEGLRERLAAARVTVIHPLLMCARDQA